MNYFAHALPFLSNPYFVAGTAVPDWLTVVDRQVRVRARTVAPWINDPDPQVASLAQGMLQHIRDDARFHETRAFAETSLDLTILAREALGADNGFRPSFLGHLLTELFLDAELIAESPLRLEAYYMAIRSVDGRVVQEAVNRMANRPTDRLAYFMGLFSQERFLSDYAHNDKLMIRLNQIMRRARLAPLPDAFADILTPARARVAARKHELLDGIPVPRGEER